MPRGPKRSKPSLTIPAPRLRWSRIYPTRWRWCWPIPAWKQCWKAGLHDTASREW